MVWKYRGTLWTPEWSNGALNGLGVLRWFSNTIINLLCKLFLLRDFLGLESEHFPLIYTMINITYYLSFCLLRFPKCTSNGF